MLVCGPTAAPPPRDSPCSPCAVPCTERAAGRPPGLPGGLDRRALTPAGSSGALLGRRRALQSGTGNAHSSASSGPRPPVKSSGGLPGGAGCARFPGPGTRWNPRVGPRQPAGSQRRLGAQPEAGAAPARARAPSSRRPTRRAPTFGRRGRPPLLQSVSLRLEVDEGSEAA